MRFLFEITENGFTKVQIVPVRMSFEETSTLLGISRTDITYLCSISEFKVLGNPERNQEKFLCAEDVLEKAKDKRWLNKITDLLYEYHSKRNQKINPVD